MAKKLVAVIVSAVFLIGACVFGFIYPGLDANFPKAESKVKITEPEFMMVFLENTPNFDDYYRGAVKSGEYNGKSFHTFSISGRYMVNQTTEKGNGDNPKNVYAMSRMDVAYGTDACFSTVECYYVEDNQDDKNELDIRIDIYATENIFYYRVRKFDFNTLFFSEAGEVGSKIEQLLKKCFQSHLNEWIDGSSILQEHTGSDMEQALYDSIVAYTAGIWP